MAGIWGGFLRGMCYLFAVLGAMWVVAAVTSEGPFDFAFVLGPLAIYIGLTWLFWKLGSKYKKPSVKAADAVIQEAAEYFEVVNRERAFPPSPTSRIIDRADCPVLASCNAKLLELGTERVAGNAGTRVKIGSMPIYLGRSVASSKTVLKEAAVGELAATTKGLIFSGVARSLELPYAKIIAIDTARDGVTVSSSDRTKPVTFIVPNGLLWGMLLKNLVRTELTSRALPEGFELQPM